MIPSCACPKGIPFPKGSLRIGMCKFVFVNDCTERFSNKLQENRCFLRQPDKLKSFSLDKHLLFSISSFLSLSPRRRRGLYQESKNIFRSMSLLQKTVCH